MQFFRLIGFEKNKKEESQEESQKSQEDSEKDSNGSKQTQEHGDEQAQNQANGQAQEQGDEQSQDQANGQAQEQGDEQAQNQANGQTQEQGDEQAQNQANEQTQKQGDEQAQNQANEQAQEQGDEQSQDQANEQAQDQTDKQTESTQNEKSDDEVQDSTESQDNTSKNNEYNKKNNPREAFRELLKPKTNNENTSKGGGLEISDVSDLNDDEISDNLINNLIEKFLKTMFIPSKDDLNSRRDSILPTAGDIRWNIPDLIRHRTTKQYTQMLYDKYGYEKENGPEEKIPLSIYFDLSGSMDEYSRILALMSLKLLKKGVKVLIGINEQIQLQIDSIPKNATLADMIYIFQNYNSEEKMPAELKKIEKELATYLGEKDAKKVIVFSDFDPKESIEALSKFAEVFWFCFEERNFYKKVSLNEFEGHFYNTKTAKDLVQHLRNIRSRYYEHVQRAKWEGGNEIADD